MSGDGSDLEQTASPVLTHLPSLTGIRAVAAFAVFLSHADGLVPVNRATNEPSGDVVSVLNWGAHGVGLFFVLSGFVLAFTWKPARSTQNYLAARVARIWPAHVIVWFAFLIAGLVGLGSRPSVPGSVASLFLVQSWVPGAGLANAVNPVAWTLSCEAFFYLTFPLVMSLLDRLDRRALMWLAAVCASLSVGVMVIILEPRGITVSTFPPYRELEFVLGAIIGIVLRRGEGFQFPPVGVSVVALAATLALATWMSSGRGVGTALVLPTFVCLVGRLAGNDLAGARSFLARPGLQRAGEASYCLYLVQLLPLLLISDLLPRAEWTESIALFVGWFVASAIAAWILHRRIEVPVIRWVRSRLAT